MKRTLLNSLILAAVTLPAVALAEDAAPAPASPFTSNVSLTNNYLYRGISQSGAKPAIQGGFDYANANGFYAGVWGSSISWLSDNQLSGAPTTASNAANSGLELDTYAGYKNTFATDYGYDVGFLRYNYPGTYTTASTKGDTNELYAKLSYSFFYAKYSYSLGNTFGVPDSSGTGYVDLTASYPIPDTTYTLGAHYGKQTFSGSSAKYKAYVTNAGGSLTYSDYNVSIAKDLSSGFSTSLTYSNTNATAAYTSVVNGTTNKLGKGTAVLALSRTF